MIRYRLRCREGHECDAWFRSSADFERQRGAGILTCAICGSGDVDKALMAPAVVAGKSAHKSNEASAGAKAPTATGERSPKRGGERLVGSVSPETAKLLEVMREIRRQVTENAEYVGSRFAEEARKIHYEEVEPHGIYGEASAEEARSLLEEGIEFHPLPVLPEDKN